MTLKTLPLSIDLVRSILDGGGRTQFRIPLDSDELLFETGELVHIKENWKIQSADRDNLSIVVIYKADRAERVITFENVLEYDEFVDKWSSKTYRAATHMPDEAIRIVIKVTSTRKERLQDISNDDMEKEGLWPGGSLMPDMMYGDIWNKRLSKSKKRKYGWIQNPLVQVIDFEVSNGK